MERVYVFFGSALAVWAGGTILDSLGSQKLARLFEVCGSLVILATILYPEIREVFSTFAQGFDVLPKGKLLP